MSSELTDAPTPPSRLLRRRAAWAVPLVVAGAVAAGSLLPATTALGTGHPKLPERSAGALLAAVQESSVTTLSGTVVETARLGLPSLPGADRSAALTWQSLVTGSHTARVWVDGPERQRVALLGELAESEVVRNGRDLWTYASDTTRATHVIGPAQTQAGAPEPAATDPRSLTPQAAAAKALAAIEPTTVVGVERTAEVAGRPAYTLRLAPRDTRSTVRQVLIAVDAETSVPLRVQVFGAATAPAFETGFTDVSFKALKPSVFRFTPPRGARVTTTRPDVPQRPAAGTVKEPAGPGRGHAPVVHGTGWTSVLEMPAGATVPAAGSGSGTERAQDSTSALVARLTTLRPDGSRVLHTTLVNGLITPDGRVFLGAVSPDLLAAAAAGKPAGAGKAG